MSKKSDFKHAVKEPDAFISTTHVVLHWIERHAAPIFTFAVLVGVSGLGYVTYQYWQSHKEAQAVDALYKYEAALKKAEGQAREARAKNMQKLAGIKSEPERPVEYSKDFAPIVGQLKEAVKAQAGTRAAMISALNLSHFLLQQKQFGEAMEVIQLPKFKPSTKDLLGGFWRMHYGLILLENSKPDEAIQVYDEVLAANDLKPFHSEALLKSAIAYEVKGDKDKAKSIYEKIGRDFAGTEAATSAAQFQRLIEMKGP